LAISTVAVAAFVVVDAKLATSQRREEKEEGEERRRRGDVRHKESEK
jgi:hypothetical protein